MDKVGGNQPATIVLASYHALEVPLKDHGILTLDEHTVRDLEIFSDHTDRISLFQLCSFTSTEGGAKVLRRRMESPWSDGNKIHATQTSLSFILASRSIFNDLPTSYSASRTEHYLNDILPMVTQQGNLEFMAGAFGLWANHDRHYLRILRGVQITSKFVRSLATFAMQPPLDDTDGELVELVRELRTLIESSSLSAATISEPSTRALRVLRLDQIFRMKEKGTILRLLNIAYEIDALVGMADATAHHGWTMPQITDGPLVIDAEGLTHPFLDQPVANPAFLDENQRLLFITGPNMAGKTTYMRALATALYLAHLGMGVPAARFRFTPVDCLFTTFSLTDDLSSGISYFRAEALRVKAVAKAIAAGKKLVAMLDEPFKGTNVKDALDASSSIIERFADSNNCLFVFSSHLIELSEQLANNQQIACQYFEADVTEGRLRFDYVIHPGVSDQRLGMRVLEEEGVFALLDNKNPEN